MRYRYTQFDPRIIEAAREKQLTDLFLQLLMHAGGDVDRALGYLDDIAERYGLWDEEMDLERFKELLEQEGYIRADQFHGKGKGERRKVERARYKPTRKAEKALRSDAFEQLFSNLRPDSLGGGHLTPYAGSGGEKLPETRRFEFGDRPQDLDYVGSISNILRRTGDDGLDAIEDDLQVFETEHATSCATVLALDISHSMILYGEDRITPAKRVALAMAELIQTKYVKDSLDVIVFGDEARVIDPRELPYVQVGPYHTNTKHALSLGQQLLERKKQVNKQIILITDGKPSAIHDGSRIYINSYGLDARIVNETVEEAQRCRRKGILITTFMITSDSYLKRFVERMSEACKGRAYYADLNNLGKFVLMDYVKNRRKQV
ncbi:hypothetical protein JXA32_15465 [Candidatus Sumerlaeota bacterium]|nr:hypothetical protein [Candidatus Sumerlaeota bacterium]